MAKVAEEARQKLDALIKTTTVNCDDIASDNRPEDWLDRPYQAVRLFYPDLENLQNKGITYASRCTGQNIPSLFQELLLGLPVLVDLVDRSPSGRIVDTESFKKA